jgi:multiple sugar transport system permease protein
MSDTSYKFEKGQRSVMERLFEPPAVGKMSPVAKVVAYAFLAFWSAFVLFPIYWVVITAFKNGQRGALLHSIR